jgi:ABC-type uncharacterized transport system permease subunit
MKPRSIWGNVAIMIVFAAVGLTEFTENVRTVQILGLFASGMVCGVSLAMIVAALRAKRNVSTSS